MNCVGIVAEYNPFHNGHFFHIKKAKEVTNSDFAVVVMSGNYVQRGEPAMVDKYVRTKMALLGGADLVIELPTIFSTSSAEFFAKASIDLLNATGIVSSMCFGSENGNIDHLFEIAKILQVEDLHYQSLLREELDKGVTFPRARALALEKYTNKQLSFLNEPNNILSIEYVKALLRTKSNIKPYTIKREYNHYHSTEISSSIASATSLRKAFFSNDLEGFQKCIPTQCLEAIYNQKAYMNFDYFSELLHFIIGTSDQKSFDTFLDVTEGIENRIIKSSKENYLISDIVNGVKTKRYTHTKIQRAILHMILGITKEMFETYKELEEPAFIRVLGFRKDSDVILKKLKRNSTVPIITNLKTAVEKLEGTAFELLTMEKRYSEIYYLKAKKVSNGSFHFKNEFSTPVVIV